MSDTNDTNLTANVLGWKRRHQLVSETLGALDAFGNPIMPGRRYTSLSGESFKAVGWVVDHNQTYVIDEDGTRHVPVCCHLV